MATSGLTDQSSSLVGSPWCRISEYALGTRRCSSRSPTPLNHKNGLPWRSQRFRIFRTSPMYWLRRLIGGDATITKSDSPCTVCVHTRAIKETKSQSDGVPTDFCLYASTLTDEHNALH